MCKPVGDGENDNRKTQWFPPKDLFTETEVSSQHSKVFTVTGGNTGIGFELIKILYGTGATIYMALRSKDKAEKAIQTLTEASPPPKTPSQVKFLQLDLNDPVSVKEAAASFAQQEAKLDVLWNNASPGIKDFEIGDRTAQGLPPMMGINCVATLLFTNLLVPQLRAASTESPSRVVWTSTFMVEGGTLVNGIDPSLLEEVTTDGMKNYAISKGGAWMLCREFARRYGRNGIVSVMQNMGNLRTGVYDKIDAFTMLFLGRLLYDPKFGGYTELYAGLSPDITLENNGACVIPWGRLRPDEACPRKDIIHAMTAEEDGGLGYGKKLWEWCELKWKPFV
ncbi:hypothetical protein G7Y89_g12934 [Cudoniella acicularis]|uniref:NAD(P)-binding protein n=1 Tax=Cudoniella acicularis TaxID=354080 RepID=A0A8H4R873_9HELO|nr:hypothetical protein G7Y89_g12934 [Cudoniella acicularis]